MSHHNTDFAVCSSASSISSTGSSPSVYVIDDDLHVRRSLHLLLSTVGFVSWSFASATDFLDNLPSLTPAPILLDIRMPELDGIALMKLLNDQGIHWPTIVITAHADIATAVQATKLGAIEFLEKPFDFQTLEASLHVAQAQLCYIKTATEVKNCTRQLFDQLTPREIDVLSLLMDGQPNKVVAHQLSLSVRTVEMHRAHVLHKLGVKSIAQVTQLALTAEISFGPRKWVA